MKYQGRKMSKSILVIDTPEDFDYRRCSIGGDGNIYYEREGEQRMSIIGNIKNLKPMPQKKKIIDISDNDEDTYEVFANKIIVGYN